MKPETAFEAPGGEVSLHRWPARRKDQLRAWDAADEHLLRVVADADDGPPDLIINDRFGGLAVPVLQSNPEAKVTWCQDSVVSATGLTENLHRNEIADDRVRVTRRVSESGPEAGGPFGRVLMKVPKSNGLLEDQLHELREHLAAGSVVYAGVMARHMQRSTLDLFSSILGDASASEAWRKSRVITATFDPDLTVSPNPWPMPWSVATPMGEVDVINHAGVFSARRLDIGTRFLLNHLPPVASDAAPLRAVDLGCGNGVVGEVLRRQLHAAGGGEVIMVDESHAAVRSAQETLDANAGAPVPSGGGSVVANVEAAASLDDVVEPASVDLVVNNPPFHEDRAMGDAVAWEMFQTSYRALVPGGTLTVIGNQHLQYHLKLQRIFGNVEVVGSNPKFVVLRARR